MGRTRRGVAAAPNPYLALDDEQLADTLGDLENAEESIKAELGRAREVALVRGLYVVKGLRWIVTRAIGSINRLDSDGLKQHLGAQEYAKWTKPGTRTTWTATRVEDVPPPPVP